MLMGRSGKMNCGIQRILLILNHDPIPEFICVASFFWSGVQ
jgi:hypothetical protein